MRWVFGLTATLGIGLAAAWLFLAPSSTPLPPTPEPSATERSEDTGFVEANANPGELASDPEDGGLVGRTDRTETTPGDGAPLGPTIRVVTGDPATPVRDALVHFYDEATYRKDGAGTSRYDAPARFGKRARTNDQGQVQLPGGTGRWLCAAQHEGSFGFVTIRKQPRDHTIKLRADEQVVIMVRAPKDAPHQSVAGVPVAVVQVYKPGRMKEIWRGRTDEDGRATATHLQMRRRSASSQTKDFRERFAALLRTPTTPLTITEFPGRPTDGKPVYLTPPPMGTVEAHLVDHAGKPLLSAATISYPTKNQTSKDGIPVRSSSLVDSVRKPVGAVSVQIPYAQLGKDVQLAARFAHDYRRCYSKKVKGPTNADQPAIVKIAPLPRHSVLAGRFLLPNDEPLKASEVDLILWRNDKVYKRFDADTIDTGQWDAVIPGPTSDAQWRLECRYQTDREVADDAPRPEGEASAGSHQAIEWLGASVPLQSWQPGTRVECGDVVLGELPPLAQGTVVDDVGKPVAGATVTIQFEDTGRSSGRYGGRFGPSGPGPSRPGPPGSSFNLSWSNNSSTLQNFFISSSKLPGNSTPRTPTYSSLRHLRTTTDASGGFAIYAQMPTGKLRALVTSKDHFAANVLLPAPATGLCLTMTRNGWLVGNALLPEWVPPKSVTMKLVPVEEARRKSDTVKARVAEDANLPFAAKPVRPGNYDVVAEMSNIKAPLLVIPDVFIQPGENRDPRLQPVDLRQTLHRYQLEARTVNDVPFAIDGPIHARFEQPDGSFVESAFRWKKGKAELIAPHPSVELTFFGNGFAPLQQRVQAGTSVIYLTPQRPALVRLPGARSLAGPTRKVRISAILKQKTTQPSSLRGVDQRTGRSIWFSRRDLGRSSGAWLEDSDLVEIPLMVAGKYELLYRAHANETTRSSQTSVSLGTFELTMDGAITTVTLNTQTILDAINKNDQKYQDQLKRSRGRSGYR